MCKMLEVVNTYLRSNDIAFGKRKRIKKRKQTVKNMLKIKFQVIKMERYKRKTRRMRNVLRKMQLRNNKQK